MKVNLKNQRALKFLLFGALAANVSWQPIKSQLQSLDLAQSAPTSETAAARPATAAATGTTTTTAPEPLVLRTQGSAPAPARAERASVLVTKTIPIDYCQGESLKVKLEEKTEGDTVVTRIFVQKFIDDEAVHTFRTSTNRIADLTSTVEGKLQPNSHLETELRKALNAKPQYANKCLAAGSPEQAKSAPSAADREAEQRKIAEGVKVCRNDAQGKVLNSESARIKCNIDRIENVEVADRNGRTSFADKAKAMREIEALIKNTVKTDLKRLLLSKDESDVEEGQELAEEMIDALDRPGSEFDPTKMEKLKREIRALVTAAEVKKETVARAEEVKELKKEIMLADKEFKRGRDDLDRSLRSGEFLNQFDPQYRQRLINDPVALSRLVNQQMDQLYAPLGTLDQQRSRLMTDFNSSLPRDPMTGNTLDPRNFFSSLRTNSLLSRADISEFTNPYTSFRNDYDSTARLLLQARTGSQLSGTPGSGLSLSNFDYANVSSYRQGLTSGSRSGATNLGRRSYTGTIPRPNGLNFGSSNSNLLSRPQMGNYGLSTRNFNSQPNTFYRN